METVAVVLVNMAQNGFSQVVVYCETLNLNPGPTVINVELSYIAVIYVHW